MTLKSGDRKRQHGEDSVHPSNTIIKFADDIMVIDLINGGDETAFRDKVNKLSHNLLFNTSKTKGMVIDFMKHKVPH